jgi:C_GCAxxG_C_C family probable redox protein
MREMPVPDAGMGRDHLAVAIGERAKNLYLTGQLLCSEAVLVSLNKGLGGDLSDDVAIRMASALPVGLGNSGCICGALSGASLAVGLFLGRSRPGSPDSQEALRAANLVHDRFKATFGSTCCRVLTRKVKENAREHFQQCAGLTGQAAEMAAAIILEKAPTLVEKADVEYLEDRDSRLWGALLRIGELARSLISRRK